MVRSCDSFCTESAPTRTTLRVRASSPSWHQKAFACVLVGENSFANPSISRAPSSVKRTYIHTYAHTHAHVHTHSRAHLHAAIVTCYAAMGGQTHTHTYAQTCNKRARILVQLLQNENELVVKRLLVFREVGQGCWYDFCLFLSLRYAVFAIAQPHKQTCAHTCQGR